MKINLIHLSDLHISDEKSKNPIFQRTEKIVAAFNSIVQETSNCFVVVSGDITISGKTEEFSNAIDFFNSLLMNFEKRLPNCDVKFLFTPGNHDCDFNSENVTRDQILKEISPDNVDKYTISKCTEVQESYFKFLEHFQKDYRINNYNERLAKFVIFDLEKSRIGFRLINTSFMTKINETQGSLVFPVEYLIEHDETSSIDYVISVIHHPYNWFEDTNARVLQEKLE